MSAFSSEREAFEKMKHAVENNPDLKSDIEFCLKSLLLRFATSLRENRFVVGGALEVIVMTALRASGVECQDVGRVFEKSLGSRASRPHPWHGHPSPSGSQRQCRRDACVPSRPTLP